VDDRARPPRDRRYEPLPDSPGSNPEERLQVVLRQLEQRFGPWIVYRLKDARPTIASARAGGQDKGQRAISSGALSLDLATGIGGFPRGRIAEVIGPPGSGKSILAFHLIANAQRQRGFVAFIDAAHRANFEQMARCGVDLTDLFLIVPENVREALDVAALLVESNGLDALVIGPLGELVGESRREAARAGDLLARLNAVLSPSPTTVVFLTDRGAPSLAVSFGRALRHFATLRIQITPLQPLVHPSGDILGLRVRAETIKNRLAPAPRQVELDLRRDRGIHQEAELVDFGLARVVLEERLAGICFGTRLLGRGRARAIAALEHDVSLALALREGIVDSLSASALSRRHFLAPLQAQWRGKGW
jgi:recombination protein RecA